MTRAVRGGMLELHHSIALLRFATSFVWADLHVGSAEETFLTTLAEELGFRRHEQAWVDDVLKSPPRPETVDPTRVSPALARQIREVALRAIAADGRVRSTEMSLFDLLDELLPAESEEPP